MDKFGNVTVLLTTQMAAVLAANLPEAELQAQGVDVENTRSRLEGAAGGEEAPRDLAGIAQGFAGNDGNERTGVWRGGDSAAPSAYEHGYAKGM